MEHSELLFLGACTLLGRQPTLPDQVYLRHSPLQIYSALQDAKAILLQADSEVVKERTATK